MADRSPSGEEEGKSKRQRSQREATVSRRAGAKKETDAQGHVQLPSYRQLKAGMPKRPLPLSSEGIEAIKAHMTAFQGSAAVQDQSLALYVNSQVCVFPRLHYTSVL